MAQWSVKEISDLTKVTVRMLHHYDKIGLLKPSMRSSNGYRWYLENDLIKLQQILALKFFGFSLNQIKIMLQQNRSIKQHFQVQQQILKDQVEHLNDAHDAITEILERIQISDVPDTPNLNDIILLIERYRMSSELKKTWAGKVLNETQLSEYINIRQQYPREFEAWEKLIVQINEMALGEPEGPEGERVVKTLLDIVQKTKESMLQQRKLNADIIASIRAGTISDLPLSKEGNMWLAKASITYWLKRWENIYQDITKNLNNDPEGAAGKKVANEWKNIIEESTIGTNNLFVVGTMMWQEWARQKVELDQQVVAASAQEMISKIHVKLFFDSAALNWIEKALNKH